MGSLSLGYRICFTQYRELPLYEVQKDLSIQLWRLGYAPLPRDVVAPCAVCVIRGYAGFCYRGDPPHTHHLVIPRNYTRNVDRTVNWFWNLIPVQGTCHKEAHGKELRDALIRKQAELIGLYILHEEHVPILCGLQWISDQIQLECLKVHIPLPTSYQIIR